MGCPRGAGLGLADARRLRIWVADGQLHVRERDVEDRVVTTVSELRRVIWLTAEQTATVLGRRTSSLGPLARAWLMQQYPQSSTEELQPGGAVIVEDRYGPVLSFVVDDMAPWGGSALDRRTSSGADALAHALGLSVESVSDHELPDATSARDVLVEPQSDRRPTQRAAIRVALTATLLALGSVVFAGGLLGPVLSLAAFGVMAWLLLLLVRLRQRFSGLVEPSPPGPRPVYRPPGRAIGALGSHLQIGPREVVAVAGGREIWLPGPAAGGVTRCVLGPQIGLYDRHDVLVLSLPVDHLAPGASDRERLAEACRGAGIEVSHDTGHERTAPLPFPLRSDTGRADDRLFSDWERGRVSRPVDLLVPAGGILHALGVVLIAATYPVAWVLLAGSLVWLGTWGWSRLTLWQWRRELRQAQNTPVHRSGGDDSSTAS